MSVFTLMLSDNEFKGAMMVHWSVLYLVFGALGALIVQKKIRVEYKINGNTVELFPTLMRVCAFSSLSRSIAWSNYR